MSSIRKSKQATQEIVAHQTPAQIFGKLQNMAKYYIKPDLGRIDIATLIEDRTYLEEVYALEVASTRWPEEEKRDFVNQFEPLKSPIDIIIRCFYKAPLYMTSDSYDEQYYDHMRNTIDSWKTIRDIVFSTS